MISLRCFILLVNQILLPAKYPRHLATYDYICQVQMLPQSHFNDIAYLHLSPIIKIQQHVRASKVTNLATDTLVTQVYKLSH